MFKLAEYILDHKEVSPSQVPTIKNFGGERPVYKDIKHVPTSLAIKLLAEEWRNRPPVYENVRKEIYWPVEKTAGWNDMEIDPMGMYTDYSKYLLGHKYNVASAGVKSGLSPWTLIKHDYTKFKPSMFSTYSKWFFGPEGVKGTQDPGLKADFRREAEWHYGQEMHHNDKVGLPKDTVTEIESICDWYSVGKTNASMSGKTYPSFVKWWNTNKEKFRLEGQISNEAYILLESRLKNNYNLWSYTVDQIKSLFRYKGNNV